MAKGYGQDFKKQPMTKLNFVTPTLAFICLALGFFLWGTCQKNKVLELKAESQNSQHKQQIAAKDTEIRTLAGEISTLKQSAIQRGAKDSIVLTGLKQANSTLTQKLAEKRPPIEVMADTIQPLRDYLILSDSLMAAKDTLIHEMTLRHSAQVVELDRIIDLQTQQIMAEGVKTKLWEEVATKNEKDYNKERRKKGFFKVTTAVAVGLCLFLAVK